MQMGQKRELGWSLELADKLEQELAQCKFLELELCKSEYEFEAGKSSL